MSASHRECFFPAGSTGKSKINLLQNFKLILNFGNPDFIPKREGIA